MTILTRGAYAAPGTSLDFKTGIKVLEVIDEVNRSLGTTTAVITHHAPIASMAEICQLPTPRISESVVTVLRSSRVMRRRGAVSRARRPCAVAWSRRVV